MVWTNSHHPLCGGSCNTLVLLLFASVWFDCRAHSQAFFSPKPQRNLDPPADGEGFARLRAKNSLQTDRLRIFKIRIIFHLIYAIFGESVSVWFDFASRGMIRRLYFLFFQRRKGGRVDIYISSRGIIPLCSQIGPKGKREDYKIKMNKKERNSGAPFYVRAFAGWEGGPIP